MKKNNIVQFECFETAIGFDEFVSRWEFYAKRFTGKDADVTLQQAIVKGRFKYVSQHKWPEDNFQFDFMKGRNSINFPDRNVKVIQAGGYMPLQAEHIHDTDSDDVKVILFINNQQTDISFYKQLPSYRHLNIYQSYYENCLYAYIMEFFVEEMHVADFMAPVKLLSAGAETGVYKECLVLTN